MRIVTLGGVRASAKILLSLAALCGVLSLTAAPAEARCVRCDESRMAEPEELRVAFPTPSGGRRPVDRVVLVTPEGVFGAPLPRRASVTNEDRLDVRGHIGDLAGVEKIFPYRLTRYVRRGERVGAVYLNGSTLVVDLSGASSDAVAIGLDAEGVAILTRSPFRRLLVGHRIGTRFSLIDRAPAPAGDTRAGDAYLTPDGLLLAPPVRTLPGG